MSGLDRWMGDTKHTNTHHALIHTNTETSHACTHSITHTHKHTHRHALTHLYTLKHTYTHPCTHSHTHMHSVIHIHTNTHTIHSFTHTLIYSHTPHAHTHTAMHSLTHTHSNTHIPMHSLIHTLTHELIHSHTYIHRLHRSHLSAGARRSCGSLRAWCARPWPARDAAEVVRPATRDPCRPEKQPRQCGCPCPGRVRAGQRSCSLRSSSQGMLLLLTTRQGRTFILILPLISFLLSEAPEHATMTTCTVN